MADQTTERPHPRAAGLHAAAAPDVLARLLDAQIAAVALVRTALPALESAAAAAGDALRNGRKMAYAGAGSSGLMALADCLELWGTFGIPPGSTPMLFAGGTAALLHMTGAVEDDGALAATDLARAEITKGDVVICVSASGTTPYTLAVAHGAQATGAQIIALSNVAASPLLTMADFPVLLDTGPEIIAGSTRLGAASAQKVALNLLSVLVGIRLGHVHDGYMVNVVADNAKLLTRAAGIVAAISGVELHTAQTAIQTAKGAVKPAVLIALGSTATEAITQLQNNGGHLSAAMTHPKPN